MTTKDDERKALQQIKKILAGLGANSYVATAIDQMVLDMAEDNINNDFACSPSDRIKSLEESETAARIRAQEATEKLESMKASRDEWKAAAERKDRKIQEQKEQQEELTAQLEEARRNCNENGQTVATQAAEIITLKAKLYDLMTK